MKFRRQSEHYRKRECTQTMKSIMDGQSVLVCGLPAVGRSYFMHHIVRPGIIEHYLGEKNYTGCFIDCNHLSDRDDYYQMVSTSRRASINSSESSESMSEKKLIVSLDNYTVEYKYCFGIAEMFDEQVVFIVNKSEDRVELPINTKILNLASYNDTDATVMVFYLQNLYEFTLQKRTWELLIEFTGGHAGLLQEAFIVLEKLRQQPGVPGEMNNILLNPDIDWDTCYRIKDYLTQDALFFLSNPSSIQRDKSIYNHLLDIGIIDNDARIFSPIFEWYLNQTKE